jgi:CheY-like chemotaxis protein
LTIRILLADDHASMRQSLRALVERQAGMEVVAEAHDGQSALRLAGEFKPDVVVMDTSMKDLKGVDAVRSVISNVPGVKFLALSMYAERQFVDGMLKAGARGYLSTCVRASKIRPGRDPADIPKPPPGSKKRARPKGKFTIQDLTPFSSLPRERALLNSAFERSPALRRIQQGEAQGAARRAALCNFCTNVPYCCGVFTPTATVPGSCCRHPIPKGGDTRLHVLIRCLNENQHLRLKRTETKEMNF